MRNVELKSRDPDPTRTLALARALGAEDRGEIVQRDTYFGGARGRLKLREQTPGDDELIAYGRGDAMEASVSTYHRAPVDDAAALATALDAALGTTIVVSKRRRLLLWDDVRIHLDDVEGLGTHLELEAVAPEDSDLSAEEAKVARLREALEIADADLIAAGYSDLLLDGPAVLLSAAQAVMAHAHVPYSHFPVGAALRSEDGTIHVAANVENAAFPQSQCAEASAIGAMVAAGATRITAIAVVAERAEVCTPCGGCRQRLSEFAEASTPVYLGRDEHGAPRHTTTLGELLPLAFGAEELG